MIIQIDPVTVSTLAHPAYLQGRIDYNENRDCPYEEQSHDYYEWLAGNFDAMIDATTPNY